MGSLNKKKLHELFKIVKDQRNEKNFNLLYEEYNDLVYRIAFSIIKNRENSEDIRQIVFLKIWKMESEKLPTMNEASWLYSLTKNETLNYIRNQRKTINLEDIYDIGIEDKELNEIIDRDTYNRIIYKLNEREKEIISLKVLANLSFREISQILNEPIGTVKWKYYKSVQMLKIILGNLGMFILTFTIGIKVLLKQENLPTQEIKNDSEATNSTVSANTTIQNVISTEQKLENEELLDRVEDKQSSINSENEETENIKNVVIPADEILIEQTNYVGIGIIEISLLFLFITIIFFIKYQLKLKHKVSKK